MDERMSAKKIVELTNSGSLESQDHAFQGNSGTEKQLFTQMQGTF